MHLGNNYKCSNGVLEPKPGEIPYLDVAIDKRKLLLDLRDTISKVRCYATDFYYYIVAFSLAVLIVKKNNCSHEVFT